MFYSGRRAYAPIPLARKLAAVPWSLVGLACAIAGFGVVSLYSVAGGDFSPWADQHGLRLAIGGVLIVSLALVPVRFWLAMAYPFYLTTVALLLLVPYVGSTVMGAKRWLTVGSVSVQPSEMAKIALVLALARYYQTIPFERRSAPLFVALPLAIIAMPSTLILKQPDLGSAAIVVAIGLAMMFLAGVRAAYFFAGIAAFAGLAEFVWQRLHDYQRSRILTFLDPDRDPLGAGYHISQSKIALGAGGLSGKGMMNGSQSQLNFLPEKHTDFIFTMFAEEMGFVGSMTLMGLYMMLLGVLALMAMRVKSPFSRLIIMGMAITVAVHVTVNIAMVIGLLPIVGVPLPLVSYGGTSMLTLMFGLGIAASAYVHRGDIVRRDELGVFL